MRKAPEIRVSAGEIKCSNKPAVFQCVGIGSCVVLFMYELNTTIGGVAHMMLPRFSFATPAAENRALFADTSPKILKQKLVARGANPALLKAKIVGGANLFDFAGSPEMAELGKANISRVKKTLQADKIYLAAEVLGGSAYKSAHFSLVTGQVTIMAKANKEIII
jgi:chemotaxis protein CheD